MAVLQMTWQPSSLSQKRKSGPPLGLKNLGNTCYLNSVLQCLTYTPPLANFCLKSQHSSSCEIGGASASEKKRECPFCILERRIARSLSLESNLDAPVKINSCLKIFAEHFRHGRQEDAHEFLRYVIDACHNTCLRLKKLQLQRRKCGESGNDGTIVKEIFGGALQSQVKCLSCGTESNKVDEIMDISLDVLHCGSLKDALQRFFQHEILDGNNKYKCDNCKKLVAARKQMSILQAPNVLVIQLKRFEGILGGKIDRAIAFEEILVLSSYMCKGSQDLYPEYRLCGTIVHSGFSPDSGHYFAYIKDAVGRWYCCNDSYVTLSTLEDVLSEKVYILFFTRSKQRPSLIKTGLLANGSKCHQSNGSNASKILNSGQPEKVANSTKHLPDRQFEINSSVISKVEMVTSDPPRKLSINESSVSRKYHANGGIKIIINRKESVEKTCNRTDSVDTDSKQHDEQILRNGNNISNVRPDDSFDAVKSKPLVTIANGNCRIQNINYHFVEGGHHGDGVREANVASNPAVSNDAENKQNNLQILSNRNGFSDVKPDDTFDAVKNKLPFTIANGNCKIWNFNGNSSNGDHHGDSVSKGNMEIEKPPNCTKLSNGDVKSHSDKLGLKRKLQDRDPCILLAKDAQSHVKVEDFKEVIGKEAKLFLKSCGWSDEVHHFMHSRKRLQLGGAGNDASNINERKRLLIKDAKPTFISKIPELLKGQLVDRLLLFSKEK